MIQAIEQAFDKPLSVPGIRLAAVAANMRYSGREDLVLMELAPSAATAAVFTRNKFCAAPVEVAAKHLASVSPRYMIINSGYANAGLGREGIESVEAYCRRLAQLAGVSAEAVLPFSTGVIGERLPLQKIIDALPSLLATLDSDAWLSAAHAIMTTDTVPKWSSRQVHCGNHAINITGIAKGAGMICPDMATLLAFVATDMILDHATTQRLLAEACAGSFNTITVDGDTSTNDAAVLTASAASRTAFHDLSDAGKNVFLQALHAVFEHLAEAIIRDAEGAAHFIRVRVEQAANEHDAREVARTIALSPLVKTAIAAGDPNWGRVLAAIGRAAAMVIPDKMCLYLGNVCVVENGAVHSLYREEDGVRALSGNDVKIRAILGAGNASATILTSDLTAEYVRINADYRS